jgi:hypothetical protein
MGLCKDNATNYLAQLGYSVVRVPRENINPLDLVGRDRDQMKLGTLDQLLTRPANSLPQVTRDQAAAHVSGQTSSKMKLGIGINILGNVLGSLAGAKLGIDAAYQTANTIQFEFKDVLYDSVVPLSVGQYLRDVDIDVGNPVLDRYVLGKGQLFLITETLKSKSITVKAEKSGGGSLVLEVPVIQEVARGKLNVDISHASSGIVTYSGNKPLTFGFKCFRVGIEDGVLAVSAATPNEVALAAGVGAPEYVLGSGLVEFDEGDLRQ